MKPAAWVLQAYIQTIIIAVTLCVAYYEGVLHEFNSERDKKESSLKLYKELVELDKERATTEDVLACREHRIHDVPAGSKHTKPDFFGSSGDARCKELDKDNSVSQSRFSSLNLIVRVSARVQACDDTEVCDKTTSLKLFCDDVDMVQTALHMSKGSDEGLRTLIIVSSNAWKTQSNIYRSGADQLMK